MTAGAAAQPVFYYDLGNVVCYLAAEQINSAMAVVPEWEPVLGPHPAVERNRIERLADELNLQRLRWPRQWPPDGAQAMLVATYAKRVGRGVAFSLAAFRQEFAAGRDLGDQDTLLIAAAACEMHPTAVLKGIGLRSVRDALTNAGRRAEAAGVRTLPAIEVDRRLFEGENAVEQAAVALEELA